MTVNGYEPENAAWLDVLTDTVKGKPVGRDPMSLPLETLTAAGHGPRRTRSVVAALGDEPLPPGVKRHKDLRRMVCMTCAENAAEVRRCAIIDCPVWPYRMGRNPHNPQRGARPAVGERHNAAPRRADPR